jgi:hypothetical protein
MALRDAVAVGAGRFQPGRRVDQQFRRLAPAGLGLQISDRREIERAHEDFGGVQTTHPLPHHAVEQLVIGDGAFPAHSAQQADRLHVSSPIAFHNSILEEQIDAIFRFWLPNI